MLRLYGVNALAIFIVYLITRFEMYFNFFFSFHIFILAQQYYNITRIGMPIPVRSKNRKKKIFPVEIQYYNIYPSAVFNFRAVGFIKLTNPRNQRIKLCSLVSLVYESNTKNNRPYFFFFFF